MPSGSLWTIIWNGAKEKAFKLKNRTRAKSNLKTGRIDLGLKTSLPIIHYTSNRQTEDFIKSEACKLMPELKVKSGVWYRLDRWRDEQITAERKITYGDLIKQFVHLNEIDTEFEKIAVVHQLPFGFFRKRTQSIESRGLACLEAAQGTRYSERLRLMEGKPEFAEITTVKTPAPSFPEIACLPATLA